MRPLKQSAFAAPVLSMLLALAIPSTGCIDTASLAVKTTSKVLVRGQPSLKMESDFDLAAAAIPASLKTVEAFHVAQSENENLIGILAEGYCQYAVGFIEDKWELALKAKNFDVADHQSKRATKAYFRCMNYGLKMVPKKWSTAIMGDNAEFEKLVSKTTDMKYRDGMMWVAVGLAGAINQNRDDIALVSFLSKAQFILKHIVALDDKNNYKDASKRALPHLALGTGYTARGPAVGGDPPKGKEHFDRAVELTGGKFLLAKVYMARGFARITSNKELFRKLLVEVLQTDPAIWPEQRLANEIAHRRARRYLELEKEWF